MDKSKSRLPDAEVQVGYQLVAGALGGNRTPGALLRTEALYRLSYEGVARTEFRIPKLLDRLRELDGLELIDVGDRLIVSAGEAGVVHHSCLIKNPARSLVDQRSGHAI